MSPSGGTTVSAAHRSKIHWPDVVSLVDLGGFCGGDDPRIARASSQKGK